MRGNRIYSSRFPWQSLFALSLFFSVALGEIYLAPTHGWLIGCATVIMVGLSFKEKHRHITDCVLDLVRWLVGQVVRACMKGLQWSTRIHQFCKKTARRRESIERARPIDRRAVFLQNW